MLIQQGKAYVLPQGSQPRIKLSGEELVIDILSYDPSEPNVIVCYPDGFKRHHQVNTVLALLDKVSGQLRSRYNVESFEIKSIPLELSGQITLGGIKYA